MKRWSNVAITLKLQPLCCHRCINVESTLLCYLLINVGPTLAHGNMCALVHCWQKGVGSTLICASALKWTNTLALRRVIRLAQRWANIYPRYVGPWLASTRWPNVYPLKWADICWLYAVPTGWPNVGPTCRLNVGPIFTPNIICSSKNRCILNQLALDY